MSLFTRFTIAFRSLFRNQQLDQELDDEVWPNPDSNLGNPSARAGETRWRGFNFSRCIKKAAAWRSQDLCTGQNPSSLCSGGLTRRLSVQTEVGRGWEITVNLQRGISWCVG